jgi:ABC-2 type transport system ATP-binding protein
MAICGRPQLLFLDEPTVGLDIQAREIMWTTLRHLVREGCSIVLTTHYLEEAEALADRVVVLAQGRMIASGTVGEMRALVVRTRISCFTTLAVEQVRAWPGVGSVSRERQRLQITATNAEAVVRRLLVADEDLQELEVRRAGLADVFTELTQEAA